MELDCCQRGEVACVSEFVDVEDIVTGTEQVVDKVRSDEACTAGNCDSHGDRTVFSLVFLFLHFTAGLAVDMAWLARSPPPGLRARLPRKRESVVPLARPLFGSEFLPGLPVLSPIRQPTLGD